MRLRWPCTRSPYNSVGLRRRAALLAVLAATTAVATAPLAASASPVNLATHAAAARPTAARTELLTQSQARTQAQRTGKPVQVTSATTPTSTLAANPNGTYTLTENSVPVRKEIGSKWVSLNATLQRGADGTVSPAVTTSGLQLSDGGTSPLVTMTSLGHSLSFTFPVSLPKPSLSGDTATYANVYPGVDLVITVDNQGGLDDVLVVKNAAAAANPALRHIALRVTSKGGLTLRRGVDGELNAVNKAGRAFFAEPAPDMWDSQPAASSTPSAVEPSTGQRIDLRNGDQLNSSNAGPGVAARTAAVGTSYSAGTLTYSPSASLLAGKSTHYPLYIDPYFPAPGPATQYYAEVNTINGGVTDPKANPLQVGYDGWPATDGGYNDFIARSFVTMSIPSEIDGSNTQIGSATLTLMNTYAPVCYNSTTSSDGDFGVQVWRTKTVTSASLPTWSSQNASGFWVTQEGPTKYFGNGYDSSCGPASEGFDVSEAATTAAHSSLSSVTFGIRADSESDAFGWKKFDPTQTSLTITYDQPPTITDLSTSPSTQCSADESIGLGSVTLYARVNTPVGIDAGATLVPTFSASETTGGAAISGLNPTGSAVVGYTSGTIVSASIPQSTFTNPLSSGGLNITSPTEFSWHVTVADGGPKGTAPDLTATSATCHFTYDPTIPGRPNVTTSQTITIGQPATFTITPPACATTTPATCNVASYVYQLNSGQAVRVDTNSSSCTSGDVCTITATPTEWSDTLYVTAVSTGGNIGQTATPQFTAAIPPPQADGDLSGNGIPDLVTPGGPGTGLAPGLWLASQNQAAGTPVGNGTLNTSMTNLGQSGNSISGDTSPTDFNGAQVITGLFTPSDDLQDVLAYYPTGGAGGQGEGALLRANGDGTPFNDNDSSNVTLVMGSELQDPNGDTPLEIANGYNAADDPNNADCPALPYCYPDLIGISGDPSSGGYYLAYYPTSNTEGGWSNTQIMQLPDLTPDGTTDWNNWMIATMPDPSGGIYLFLYKYQSSGSLLYVCQGFQLTSTQPATYGLSSDNCANATTNQSTATQLPIPTSNGQLVSSGTVTEIRAANITGSGPAFWAVSSTGSVSEWSVNLSGTPSLTQGATQSLISPTHAYALSDGTSGLISTAADTGSGSPLNLTDSGNVYWDSDPDLFSPAANFNSASNDGGADNGWLSEGTGGVVDDDDPYTISAWVKPDALGGAVFSQSGADSSCYMAFISTTTVGSSTYGTWNFRVSNADVDSPTWATATAGNTYYVKLGAWTHLTVSYAPANSPTNSSSTGYLRMYVNGIPAAAVSAPTTWGGGCENFSLGRYIGAGATHGLFQGEIADVQTWYGTAMTPNQVANISGNHGFYIFPNGTRYTSAASATTWTWQTQCGEMNFYQAKITIKQTCTGTATDTFGPGGNAAATLAVQGDGNLVIYSGTGTALWDSATNGNPNDVMFFQPDGNLVIYTEYGETLWSSDTQNMAVDG